MLSGAYPVVVAFKSFGVYYMILTREFEYKAA